MISGDLTSPGTAKQGPNRPEPRVRTKPAGAQQGLVDGGWWPRSRNPESEFPDLVVALQLRIGVVNRITYHPPDAPEEAARAALVSAARPVIPAARSTEPLGEERWETDGGHARTPAPAV
jgi:hypothetical protein